MSKKNKNYKKVLTEMYHLLCKAFGPQRWWPGETPFEIAVGAILTQNTNWGNVEKAINNLKKQKSLNAKTLHNMADKKLALLIKPAGYYNIKTKRLKNFLDVFTNHYKGSIEKMKTEDKEALREKLLNINGIGPETADSILLYALEKPIFVIDAYTKRALVRHGIVSEGSTYHEMQEIFHKNLPQDTTLFNEFHALFVKLGKDFCRTKPRCEACPLKGIQ
ncbi:MAG: endonuclease III domain-containing protein [Nitrospirae bacterium]|nr:endonuclease III domain-containing protein [Nitrospirota bacterium]